MYEGNWYYEQSGVPTGPVSGSDLGKMIRAGLLARGARVWRAGMPGWQNWEAIRELSPLAGPPPLHPRGDMPVLVQATLGTPLERPAGGSTSAVLMNGNTVLRRVSLGAYALLGLLTFGIFPIVKFYQCGIGYAALSPGRGSTFRKLFWRYVRVSAVAALIGLAPARSLLLLANLYAIFVGDKLIGEVMAGRSAAIGHAGVAVLLTTPAVHTLLFLGPQFLFAAIPIVEASSPNLALALMAFGACSFLAQQALFFVDHNRLVSALSLHP